MSGAVLEVTDATFDAEVLGSEIPVLVDVWATWCAPCRRTEPIIEALAEEQAGRVKVVKVDADANPEVLTRHGVVSIPTFLLYSGGHVVATMIGAQSPKAFDTMLTEHLGAGGRHRDGEGAGA